PRLRRPIADLLPPTALAGGWDRGDDRYRLYALSMVEAAVGGADGRLAAGPGGRAGLRCHHLQRAALVFQRLGPAVRDGQAGHHPVPGGVARLEERPAPPAWLRYWPV